MNYIQHSDSYYIHVYRLTTWLWRNPLVFAPLAKSLLLQSHFSFTYLETLLGVIGSRPPWPQVTCKLTSPFPSPPHSLPIPNSHHPRSIVRLTKTTSWTRLLMVWNKDYWAMDGTYTMDNVFLMFSVILPWELSKGPPWQERETRIHEYPLPVPTQVGASPQARKEVQV